MDLFGRDPIPRERRDEVADLTAEFEGLYTADGTRLKRYTDYRKENESGREGMPPGETFDYGQRQRNDGAVQRHRIPLPLGKALTVKHAYRISGRLPDAVVERRQETAEERYRSDTMEKIWWGIMRESGDDTMLASGAWDGSELGSAVYSVYWKPDKEIPCILSHDPAGIIVVRGLYDPHEYERIYHFWDVPLATAKAQYRNVEFADGNMAPVDEMTSSHKTGDVPMVRLVKMCDKRRAITFALGAEGERSVPLVEVPHDYGFVPYRIIPNIGPERDIWGFADYEFVRALVAYIPTLLGREADILRMVANGAYQDTGTGQDAKAVKDVLAKGGVLPARRDGEVKPIDPPQTPSFAQGHSDRVMELFKMLGFAPDAAWGGSDTRSGADRALQLQPLIELTAMKQTNWTSGLSDLGSMAFRIIEKMQTGSTTYRGARPGATARQRRAFQPFQIGADAQPIAQTVTRQDPLNGAEFEEDILLPRTPKELFDGDYAISFFWQNRIDPDDPAFVLSELNKFVQGVQSLETTLDRLGFQAPEDEMKRIEAEAKRFPWLRQGMIPLIMASIRANTQGQGGGAPTDVAGGMMDALGMLQGSQGGSLGADAGTRALPGGTGQQYGGA